MVAEAPSDIPSPNAARGGSPPTARVLAVLESIAAHQGVFLSPTDIADSLGISRSTARAILRELEHQGYVSRQPHTGTYTIGYAPIAVGNFARQRHPVVRVVSAILENLRVELDFGYSILARADDDLLVVDRVGEPDHAIATSYETLRVPLIPPLGITFVALSNNEEVERWLARGEVDGVERRRLLDLVASIRTDGYLIERRPAALDSSLLEALVDMHRGSPAAELARHARHLSEQLASTAAEETDKAASAILAPVLDTDGQAVLVVALHVLRRGHDEAQIEALAIRLRSLLQSASAALFG